jgi:RimJ/RimL family protein N-acetyltransferase
VQTVALQTPRLVLDAVGPGDAARIAEYCSDPELQRFVPVPVPYGLAEAEEFIGEHVATVASSARGMLWAIRAGGAGFAGVVELMPRADGLDEIGFWMGASHRGHGYMTEAVRAVVEHAFDAVGERRILWRGYLDNVASAVVARRAGFRYEGVERAGGLHRGDPVDMHRAAILATDSRDEAPAWP